MLPRVTQSSRPGEFSRELPNRHARRYNAARNRFRREADEKGTRFDTAAAPATVTGEPIPETATDDAFSEVGKVGI